MSNTPNLPKPNHDITMTPKLTKTRDELARDAENSWHAVNGPSYTAKHFEEAYSLGFDAACALLLPVIEEAREALKVYMNYDKETVRHMDTEFLKPERMAVIKPLNSLSKPYAPKDMHPSQIYQDDVFTYGPKERQGKVARQALKRIDEVIGD